MKDAKFKPVDTHVDFPKLEEQILKRWKENKVFEKSVEGRPPDKKWTFLDGPPFVTGMPHYGTLLSSLPKDLYGRYWTMKGFKVTRLWGWDGHGLPIENKVENALGIKSKREIESKVGVGKFIEECKKYVNDVSGEWEWYVDHIGRWVDFKNAYKTWDRNYMESVMWVFKQMYEKGYIYKGLKNSLYCPHCATPISNFEVAMDAENYKELEDHATTYKYALEGEENTYVLAWSTTPWNKIVTPALAINPKFTYIEVEQNGEKYILAKTTKKMLQGPYKTIREIKGKDLVGKKYVPHYNYYKIEPGKVAFELIAGDFVTADEGTGVVTIAPYGEEDLKVMQEQNIHIEIHLDEEGNVKPDVPNFGGMYYLKANKAVNEDLAKRGLIYKDEMATHNVPLCWRCHTRLYNAAINAWYVNVQTLKPLMKKTNETVNWFPKHFKHGRFLKSLENAPDWNISRNRYWGSPVPVWECTKCQERFVPGSISELEEASGSKIADLHKPEIDEVIVKCKKCGSPSKRTSEVLDSWIEAGSASFAERHFPFNNPPAGGEKLEDFFPPDYIAEYTGQIRAWFYVLHVIGAALYKSPAFKNVSVEGVILGTDGRKMSKNFNNYPDPKELLQKYGGDALRLYLLGSPVMHGEDIIISEEQYRNQVRGQLLILWNVYNFFVTNATTDNWDPNEKDGKVSTNVLDRWILSRLNSTIEGITKNGYEKFDSVEVVGKMSELLNDLSLWYIRRTRDRVGPSVKNKEDKNAAYQTMWQVLVVFSQIVAPLVPFISEEIYTNLTKDESVHLTDWPKPTAEGVDKKLEEDMRLAREIVSQAHALRKENNIKVRQPLASLTYGTSELPEEVANLIAAEVNVKKVEHKKGAKVSLDVKITPALKLEGEARDIIRSIQQARKEAKCRLDEYVTVILPSWPKEFEEQIKSETLTQKLEIGEGLQVVRS